MVRSSDREDLDPTWVDGGSGQVPEDEQARAVRVVRLMRALDAGTYEPDPRKVAEAMLRANALRSLCGDWH